jgi:hypothetical protein
MRVPTLQQFFRHQIERGFHDGGLDEPETVEYVSDVLARFAETRNLYAVTDAAGQPLQYIVDFLVERQRAEGGDGGRADYARARTLLRHLGEYALFMTGLFRERLVRRGELPYYLAQGANAYWQCAEYEIHPSRRRLYSRLHTRFKPIADTLNGMYRQLTPAERAARHPLAAFWQS